LTTQPTRYRLSHGPYGKRELLDFFDRQLRDHGYAPQSVRWTPEDSRLRYEAFRGSCGDLQGKSLLDFGCGKGDFSTAFCATRRRWRLLRHRREFGARRPWRAASTRRPEFLALDVEEAPWERHFDVVVACGSSTCGIGGIAASLRETAKILFGLCGNPASQFSHGRAPRHDVELHYASRGPAAFCLEDFPEVTLRHGLVPDDVYLSVYRCGP